MTRPIVVFSGLGVATNDYDVVHGKILQFAETLHQKGYDSYIVSTDQNTVSSLLAFQKVVPNVKILSKEDLLTFLIKQNKRMFLVCDAAPYWFDHSTNIEQDGKVIKPPCDSNPSQVIEHASRALEL